MSTSIGGDTPQVVDNTGVRYYINPQYANVTDVISAKASDYVKTAQISAYSQTLAVMTTPKWSFSYMFNGTRISLYGTIIPYIAGPLASAQYAVDGASTEASSVQNVTQTLSSINFYTSDYFSFGEHVLTVNVTSASSSSPYIFDYLAIYSSAPASSSPASEFPSNSSSNSDSSPNTGSGSQNNSTSSEPPSEQTVGAASRVVVSTGAVVGGVIGGVVLLAAVVFGIWWLWKRNRTYDESSYAYVKTGQYDGPADHVEAYPVSHSDELSTAGTMADGLHYSDAPKGSSGYGSQAKSPDASQTQLSSTSLSGSRAQSLPPTNSPPRQRSSFLLRRIHRNLVLNLLENQEE
ncbi:hypothetical protein C8Q80DRAFT_1191190 [Daedaleopsis nitida]|nr:hypothetical protein C8Q80DRAFT_1191190 [Daedaleopsis nitida]